MKFEQTLVISGEEAEHVHHLMTHEPESEEECYNEGKEPIFYSVPFPNGYRMEFLMIGPDYDEGRSNLPWTEAALFDPDRREHDNFSDDWLDGTWTLCDDHGNEYEVFVYLELKNRFIGGVWE